MPIFLSGQNVGKFHVSIAAIAGSFGLQLLVADVGVKTWESFHVILLRWAIAMCLGWCRWHGCEGVGNFHDFVAAVAVLCLGDGVVQVQV